jgi:hypothetical protein
MKIGNCRPDDWTTKQNRYNKKAKPQEGEKRKIGN